MPLKHDPFVTTTTKFGMVPGWVFSHQLARLRPTVINVYIAMWMNAECNYKKRTTRSTWEDIAELTGYGRSLIYRDVADMKAEGIVQEYRKGFYFLPADDPDESRREIASDSDESSAAQKSTVVEKEGKEKSTVVDETTPKIHSGGKKSTVVDDTIYTDTQSSFTEILTSDADASDDTLEKNKPSKEFLKSPYSQLAIGLCDELAKRMVENRRRAPKVSQDWYEEMDRVMRLDKRDPEEVHRVLTWSQNSNFWKSNINSPSKFRLKYDDLWLQMGETARKVTPRGQQGLMDFMASKGISITEEPK